MNLWLINNIKILLLHSGGAGESVDATCSVSSEQSVVSLLPPARAPGVLDDPETWLVNN